MKKKNFIAVLSVLLVLIAGVFLMFFISSNETPMERYANHIKENQYKSLRTYQNEPVIGFYLTEDKNNVGIIKVNHETIIETEIEITSNAPTVITLEGEEENYVGIVLSDEVNLSEAKFVSLKGTDIGNLPIDTDQEVSFSFGFSPEKLSNVDILEIMNENLEVIDEMEIQ